MSPARAAIATVTTVANPYSPISGGVTTTVTGTGFSTATGVTISGTAATFSIVSDTEMRVTTPALVSSGYKTLAITNPDGLLSAANQFFYYDTAVSCGTSGAFYIQNNTVVAAVACIGTVNVPSGVTTINGCTFGNAAGGNCGTLSGNAVTAVTLPSTMRTIGGAAFLGASTMTSINIPEGVTSIGNSAFYMSGKHPVNIPTTVTNIATAFYRSNVTEVTFSTPTSLTALGDSTFRATPNLTSIVIPEGVTTLSNLTFGDIVTPAQNLRWISLPSTLTSVNTSTTFINLLLTCVINPGNTTYINNLTFPNSPTIVTDIANCPAPTFSSISASSGTTQGGVSASISGTNLLTVNSVTIGGAAATITSKAATSLTITTPAGTVGAKDLVLNTYGHQVTSASAYTYLPLPTFSSLSVTSGPTSGGTSTILTGLNLSSITAATIGGASATRSGNTSTSLTLTTPAGTVGAKDIVITNANGTLTITGAFTYVELTASFSSFSLSGSVTAATYRVPITITATVAYQSKITFKSGNLKIPGCIGKSTGGSAPFTATCSWKPAGHGTVVISAVATPVAGGITVGRSLPIAVTIANRSGSR